MFVLTVECCCVTVGNRAVCWYENRSAAIKLCHVVFHTVMNVVHYCRKECSWLVQKLLSSYKNLINWLFVYTAECCYIEIGRSAVCSYGTCPAGIKPFCVIVSLYRWILLHCGWKKCSWLLRELLSCFIVWLFVWNFAFLSFARSDLVNVFVLLRSLSWENFNGRVKCTFWISKI